MEHYVKAYEKENRKIQILFVIRFIPIFILYFFTALWSLPVGATLFIILYRLILIYRKKAIVNNISRINVILDESMDIELVLSIYEKLFLCFMRAQLYRHYLYRGSCLYQMRSCKRFARRTRSYCI